MNQKSLIAYCCFGEAYARMLNISLQSLLDVGNYRGSILIVTDLDPEVLRICCPIIVFPGVEVIRADTRHELAPKLLRYRLHRYFDLSVHAPILYVDCDIVFDQPVAPMLEQVRVAEAICFPSEPNSSAMWEPMGGDLLRAEGIAVGGYGFNSGTMGIPDGGHFRYFVQLEHVISTAFDLWETQRDMFGRWVDQPVVNYIQVKFQVFDTHRLTPYLRFCGQAERPDSADRLRAGAVHFFDFDKEARMRDYLARISSLPLAERMVADF